ncbi:MAG TPA: hypothetical protein DCO83_17660 [Mucilaginibacter sp.]|jgi:hypothetical protein|nr:hypothetical protein [Mucilaginibacter sp.]
MSNQPNLKNKNLPSLWVFFSFEVAVLLSLFYFDNFSAVSANFHSLLNIRTSSVLISPLVLFVVNGLLSSDQKAALVFWRIKNILPGCRAFSVHGKNDFRVDLKRLESIHGPLPVDPKEQNLLWYKIYQSQRKDSLVQTSHQRFLLARDIVAISFLFIPLVGVPFIFLGKQPLNWFYLCLLIFQYLLLMVTARNYGCRFVTNVLAGESLKKVVARKKSG